MREPLVHVKTAALRVFFTRHVLRGHRIDAESGQKQRLVAQIPERVRRDGALALQRVHHRERGLAVRQNALAQDDVSPVLHAVLVGGEVAADDGVSHDGRALRAEHRIRRVRPVGRVVLAAVAVVVRQLRVAREEQPVGRAVHAVQRTRRAAPDAPRVPFHRAARRDAHIVLALNRAHPRRFHERHNARFAVHREIRALGKVRPHARAAELLRAHGRSVKAAERQMILRGLRRAEKALGERRLHEIQVLVLRASAPGRAGDGKQRRIGRLRHRRDGLSVEHEHLVSVDETEFLCELPRAAARVGEPGAQKPRLALLRHEVQLRARVHEIFFAPGAEMHAVDARAEAAHRLIAHALAHLARHVADHVLAAGRAALVDVRRAVRVIDAEERVDFQNAARRLRRDGKLCHIPLL